MVRRPDRGGDGPAARPDRHRGDLRAVAHGHARGRLRPRAHPRRRHRVRAHRRALLALPGARPPRRGGIPRREPLRQSRHHRRARRLPAVRRLRSVGHRLEGRRTRLPAAARRAARHHREHDPAGRLAESDAILFYLAEGTRFLPEERLARAEVLQWMFFEQYSHEPYIAVARFWTHYLGKAVDAEKTERGYQALDVMERHLGARQFFVGERYTIADVALYAYTHVAHEGGFDLAAY